MNGKTHMLGGLTAIAIYYISFNSKADLSLVQNQCSLAILTGAAVFGAKLPDIDTRRSSITNKNRLLSFLIRVYTKHRGITHSHFLLFIFMTLFMPLLELNDIYINNFIIGFFLGYLSHLIYDMMNPKGIPLFYPVSKNHIHIAKIVTGSFEEIVFRFINLLLLIFMLYKIFIF